MVRRTKLLWQLFPLQILILTGAMLLIAWYGSNSMRRFYVDQLLVGLEAQSRLIEEQVGDLIATGKSAELARLCRESGSKAKTRITVVAMDGTVMCDSYRKAATMDNHRNRPEIARAFVGGTGISQRYSSSTGQEMLYLAIPLRGGEDKHGVLRTSIPLTLIDQALKSLFVKISLALFFVTLLASYVAFLSARKVSRPLETMTGNAIRYAKGDFTDRIDVSGSEEVVSLAQAMNRMADEITERIQAIENQKNEFETVVASMVEGVIAVDLDASILYINESASRQLGVDNRDVKGQQILEVVRNIELANFIRKTLQQDDHREGTVIFNRGRDDERVLQVHGAQLADAGNRKIGALFVINDVTRLLQLESLRRDFVANVSHELKTPITSIKGYAETMLAESEGVPPHFRAFLEIVSRQTNRLQAIIEDLLLLSRIEREEENDELRLEESMVNEVLCSAVETCSSKATDKGIDVNLDLEDDLETLVNTPLLEQAFINLIDNAVKYNNRDGTIKITGRKSRNFIEIEFADSGLGIAEEHLPRLFERFYVIDKARSRKLGGTGLGLAIVKHIIQAHHGQITVASKMGQGSVFTVSLPVAS